MNIGKEIRELTVHPVEWPQPATPAPEPQPAEEPVKVGAE